VSRAATYRARKPSYDTMLPLAERPTAMPRPVAVMWRMPPPVDTPPPEACAWG